MRTKVLLPAPPPPPPPQSLAAVRMAPSWIIRRRLPRPQRSSMPSAGGGLPIWCCESPCRRLQGTPSRGAGAASTCPLQRGGCQAFAADSTSGCQ
ncbi:hypothetical protein VFPBJ_10477 [Purpureocillium lilacinum]|uniref:Uncharacterized protein n=1 Tax=Purpureocillium lilacinum TaxID=33203 RepID=A0A179G2K7_PURLI|nr:hypothetical protein VFPBJ_10477 [Purpureocillium lilacinum]